MRYRSRWTKEKAHRIHTSDSLVWLSRILEQPNLAQCVSVTHRPFTPDVPEMGRPGTALKSAGVSSSSQPCQLTTPMSCPLTCKLQVIHLWKGFCFVSKKATRNVKMKSIIPEKVYFIRNLVAYISFLEIQEPEVECRCLDLVSATNPWQSTCLVLEGICPPFLQSSAWKQTSSHRALSSRGPQKRDSLDLLPDLSPHPIFQCMILLKHRYHHPHLGQPWSHPGSPFFVFSFSSSFLPAEMQMDCWAVERALFSAHCLNWCNFFRNNFLYYIPRGKNIMCSDTRKRKETYSWVCLFRQLIGIYV